MPYFSFPRAYAPMPALWTVGTLTRFSGPGATFGAAEKGKRTRGDYDPEHCRGKDDKNRG